MPTKIWCYSFIYRRYRADIYKTCNQKSWSQPDVSSWGSSSSRGQSSKFDKSYLLFTAFTKGAGICCVLSFWKSNLWKNECFLMSAMPSFWFPSRSSGICRSSRRIKSFACFVILECMSVDSMPRNIWRNPKRNQRYPNLIYVVESRQFNYLPDLGRCSMRCSVLNW